GGQEPAVLQLQHNRTVRPATGRRLLTPGYKSKQETHSLLCSDRTVQRGYFSQPIKENGVKRRKGARRRCSSDSSKKQGPLRSFCPPHSVLYSGAAWWLPR